MSNRPEKSIPAHPVQGTEAEANRSDNPADRDAIMMCLTLENKDGKQVQSWAIMDTGSSAHFISRNLVEALGRVDEIQSADEVLSDIGTGSIHATGKITLSVLAGHQQRPFKLDFDIVEHPDTALLVGESFLYDSHALTIDPEYTNKPTLPVIGDIPVTKRHCYSQRFFNAPAGGHRPR